MPYIKADRRQQIDKGSAPTDPGELNYLITVLIKQYWDRHPRYVTGNDILGVLSAAGSEFYRRVMVPYEDSKIRENGDVY